MSDKTEIEDLREWAVKKAAMYDMKYNKYNDVRSLENKERYHLVVELCDKVQREQNERTDRWA